MATACECLHFLRKFDCTLKAFGNLKIGIYYTIIYYNMNSLGEYVVHSVYKTLFWKEKILMFNLRFLYIYKIETNCRNRVKFKSDVNKFL